MVRDVEVVDKINIALQRGDIKNLLLGRSGLCIPTDYPELPTELGLIIPHLYRYMKPETGVARLYTRAIMSMIQSDEPWQIYMAGQILLLQLYYEASKISPIIVSDTLITAFRIRYPEVLPFFKGRINRSNKALKEYGKTLL